MTTYFGVLEGKDDVWGVWFPDVPGCAGGGPTAEAAIEDAQSALSVFHQMDMDEGIPSPVARTREELLTDPEVAAALADGDRLLAFNVGGLPNRVQLTA